MENDKLSDAGIKSNMEYYDGLYKKYIDLAKEAARKYAEYNLKLIK